MFNTRIPLGRHPMANIRCQHCQTVIELTPALRDVLIRDHQATLKCGACRKSFEFVIPKTIGMESTAEFYPFGTSDPGMDATASLPPMRPDFEPEPKAVGTGGVPAWLLGIVVFAVIALIAAAILMLL